MANVVLKGREVLSQMRVVIDGTDREDKNSVPYWIATYGGTGFTVREDVKNAWQAGEIAELTLVEGTRTITDEETGAETTVPSIQYGGHMTYNQLKNVVTNEAELVAIEKRILREFEVPATAAAMAAAEAI